MNARAKCFRDPEANDERPELAAGLSSIVAAVLWAWVGLAVAGAPELCSTARGGVHCAICYPAVAATLTALGCIGWLLRRRLLRT